VSEDANGRDWFLNRKRLPGPGAVVGLSNTSTYRVHYPQRQAPSPAGTTPKISRSNSNNTTFKPESASSSKPVHEIPGRRAHRGPHEYARNGGLQIVELMT